MQLISFVAATRIPASAQDVFDWHEAPGAFERLTPPWERVRVLLHEGGIRNGARVSLLVGPAPFSLRWDLEHRDYHHGHSFTDLQLRGPFRHWRPASDDSPGSAGLPARGHDRVRAAARRHRQTRRGTARAEKTKAVVRVSSRRHTPGVRTAMTATLEVTRGRPGSRRPRVAHLIARGLMRSYMPY